MRNEDSGSFYLFYVIKNPPGAFRGRVSDLPVRININGSTCTTAVINFCGA